MQHGAQSGHVSRGRDFGSGGAHVGCRAARRPSETADALQQERVELAHGKKLSDTLLFDFKFSHQIPLAGQRVNC